MNRRRIASMLRAGRNFLTPQPFTQHRNEYNHPRQERRQTGISARQQHRRKLELRWARLAAKHGTKGWSFLDTIKHGKIISRTVNYGN